MGLDKSSIGVIDISTCLFSFSLTRHTGATCSDMAAYNRELYVRCPEMQKVV